MHSMIQKEAREKRVYNYNPRVFCNLLNYSKMYHLGFFVVVFCCLYPRKEGNVLFNDALNTFYLRLYGVRHMVKDHSESARATWATLSD